MWRRGCSTPPYHKSALRPSNWPPNTHPPRFRDFSYFYMNYLISKKIFGFSQWFRVFRRGGANNPHHLTYIFAPATNRVNCIMKGHKLKHKNWELMNKIETLKSFFNPTSVGVTLCLTFFRRLFLLSPWKKGLGLRVWLRKW